MQGKRIAFSIPGCIFSDFYETTPPEGAAGARLTPETASGFFKNCPYYTISIRQNQLFFATFPYKIANSSLCTGFRCKSSVFLVKSHNLIFFDGIQTDLAGILPLFPCLFLPAHGRHSSGIPGTFSRRGRIFAARHRCSCNQGAHILHFAGCGCRFLHHFSQFVQIAVHFCESGCMLHPRGQKFHQRVEIAVGELVQVRALLVDEAGGQQEDLHP